jgi:hypothetical protein
MSRCALTGRAKKEGWVRRVGTKPLKSGPKPRAPRRPSVRKLRRDLAQRLLEALDKRLTLLETRMNGELDQVTQSAADAERDARALSSYMRIYAKIVELDEKARGAAKKASDKSAAKPEEACDADRLRRDLALRLQRLNQARDA